MTDHQPLTVTDMYDSGQDPTTAVLPPMVDPRIFDDPPPCMDQNMAGFRRLNPDQIAEEMGVPAAFRVVEPLPDLRPAVTPADVDRWMRTAKEAVSAVGGSLC